VEPSIPSINAGATDKEGISPRLVTALTSEKQVGFGEASTVAAGASSNGATEKNAIAPSLLSTATAENQAGAGAASALVLLRQHSGPALPVPHEHHPRTPVDELAIQETVPGTGRKENSTPEVNTPEVVAEEDADDSTLYLTDDEQPLSNLRGISRHQSSATNVVGSKLMLKTATKKGGPRQKPKADVPATQPKKAHAEKSNEKTPAASKEPSNCSTLPSTGGWFLICRVKMPRKLLDSRPATVHRGTKFLCIWLP
jgi:hypothetical protein